MGSENNVDKNKNSNFPIVGIGASAGGLDAFKEFFSGMPHDSKTGMAFVLVQHLAPDHNSVLTDIIQRLTKMEVKEVTDGMEVEPDCAYIIPPNYDMTFQDGSLHLKKPSSPRGHRMPIDVFFRSLAESKAEHAICVILSGTGSDGTLGLRAIKGQGGMAMVQKPETAKYDGMPHSALETGLVDYELEPAAMPEELCNYAQHSFGLLGSDGFKENILDDKKVLKKIFLILRNHTGHDFSYYKKTTILRRIQLRMSVQQIDTIEEYYRYLQQSPEEVKRFFQSLLIGVTRFFRDHQAFDILKQEVIPQLFANNQEEGRLRIWVPGCSSGEEAYSIAILLDECQEEFKQRFNIQIFATDIDTNAITAARQGVFPATIADDISERRLSNFFDCNDAGKTYKIHKRIREMVVFSVQNLTEDPPFSWLDLISCRNLLIYMTQELQEKVISLFRYALDPGGFLFLGNSETLGDANSYFNPVSTKWKIYQLKKEVKNNILPKQDMFLPSKLSKNNNLPITSHISKEQEELALKELTEKNLLEEFSPPAILVTKSGEMLYIQGRTGQYLEPAPGKSRVNNILRMARPGLLSDLTVALNQSVKHNQKIYKSDIQVEGNNDITVVNLSVVPVKNTIDTSVDSDLYLVVLEEKMIMESDKPLLIDDLPDSDQDISPDESQKIIAKLRQKLKGKEESLQNTVEELQTANEELKSSNEELQSLNEELQSANEELETSKEELQSLNEELKTVNSELENKVAELTQTNTDMKNLLAGTGIGTVFVDLDLNILRFTPSATKFINLIETDIGRPVNHIASNLKNYDNLVEDTQEVLSTLIPKEIEVQTEKDQWHMMHIHPYRTENNVIKGASLTFRDISEKKELEIELEKLKKGVQNGE
ncbi:MAG: chemotaxis protein CheB [Halarsenatibacteraceae bacterium]